MYRKIRMQINVKSYRNMNKIVKILKVYTYCTYFRTFSIHKYIPVLL